jgi:hypothetical protein
MRLEAALHGLVEEAPQLTVLASHRSSFTREPLRLRSAAHERPGDCGGPSDCQAARLERK